MDSVKRRVDYTDLGYCKEGESARVLVAGVWYRTTNVIWIRPLVRGPVFETKNSIYWPAPAGDEPLSTGYVYKHPEKVNEFQI